MATPTRRRFTMMTKFLLEELNPERLENLIASRSSFEISGLVSVCVVHSVALTMETAIETAHCTCRIYTRGRAVVATEGLLLPHFGLPALLGIALHNLFTYAPDYEICRDFINRRVIITFKKQHSLYSEP